MPATISQWENVVYHVLRSHYIYKRSKNIQEAIDSLAPVTYLGSQYDWVVAAKEWFMRRTDHKLEVTTHNDEREQYIIKGFRAEDLKHEDPK